uniref:Aldehyde dehydrogenase domain-containing protein n=1 Tax=Physcomitrium patens TaxID=3218 RepID=A0A7I4AX83_PHYPA
MNPVPRLDTSQVASSLRAAFRTGRTRSVKWRLEQLHAIVKLLEENEEDIYWALDADLRKPRHEAFLSEKGVPLLAWPASASIVPEPLGVVFIMSPWNFPFMLAVDPLIGAISAGCAVCLKASEITPTTSALLARLIPKYLDTNAIQVVEG